MSRLRRLAIPLLAAFTVSVGSLALPASASAMPMSCAVRQQLSGSYYATGQVFYALGDDAHAYTGGASPMASSKGASQRHSMPPPEAGQTTLPLARRSRPASRFLGGLRRSCRVANSQSLYKHPEGTRLAVTLPESQSVSGFTQNMEHTTAFERSKRSEVRKLNGHVRRTHSRTDTRSMMAAMQTRT